VKGGLIRLIGALVLLIMMYPMFGYLILPAGLLLLGVNAVFRKILKKLHKQVQETDGNLRIFPAVLWHACKCGAYPGDRRVFFARPFCINYIYILQ